MNGVARSQTLLEWKAAVAGFSPAFTSPAGHVTLVKSLYAVHPTGLAFDITMLMANAGQSIIGNWFHQNVPANSQVEHQSWLVLNPGESIWAWVSIAAPVIWVSGAVLVGANVFPPAGGAQLQALAAAPESDEYYAWLAYLESEHDHSPPIG